MAHPRARPGEELGALLREVPRDLRVDVVEHRLERGRRRLLGNRDRVAETLIDVGHEALETMKSGAVDCVVLDLRLPDMTGFELLELVEAEPALADVPVVVFTGKDLSADEEQRLKLAAKSIILKDVQSPERLLDETALFLHRVITELPEDKQRMLVPRATPANGDRQRRPLIEVGEEETWQAAGGAPAAPGADERSDERCDDPDPQQHCVVVTPFRIE